MFTVPEINISPMPDIVSDVAVNFDSPIRLLPQSIYPRIF